jgi:DNA-binding transcriptional MerR regulator
MREAAERTLTIGAFARRARLSPKALRLYDRLGVLSPAAVDEHNGYRRYRESQLAAARLIVALRRLDMPLARVASVVSAPPEARAPLIEAYWAEVEGRIAGQRQLLAHLLPRLSGQEGTYAVYDVQQRDVTAQTVVTERTHVLVDDLSNWISDALGRLYGNAELLGLKTGDSFVIYHGEVTEDSDGPVECCVPVTGEAELDGGLTLDGQSRIEPAHREAYTRITVAQVEFPQILSAYEAVERWVQQNGKEVIGPPREVYLGDFAHLAPNDEGCDIAFPIR